MSDKDKALVQQMIEGVFGKRGQSPIYQTAGRLIEELSAQFVAALATVRRGAREEAFKDAIELVSVRLAKLKAQTATLDGISGAACMGRDMAVEEIIAALERAAESGRRRE